MTKFEHVDVPATLTLFGLGVGKLTPRKVFVEYFKNSSTNFHQTFVIFEGNYMGHLLKLKA